MGEESETLMRIVLDTNVLISALLFGDRLAQFVKLWRMGRIKLLVSRDITNEYLKVLAYPKFELTKREIFKIIREELAPYVERVEITHTTHAVLEDASDNKFLECAVSGKAHYIVSGDEHLLVIKSYKGIPIITASKFLGLMD